MSRLISDLDSRFQPFVKKLLDESNKLTSPWKTFITDGFRTYAEQADLYASGRTKIGKILTNAPPGTSNHEKGLAVDIAFQKDGKLSYGQKYYDLIVPIAKKLGITWGGDWKDFPDKPHFEKLKFDDNGTIIEDVITDQTKIPQIIDAKGNAMEVQAIRSTINDQERTITILKTEKDALLHEIDVLKSSVASCNQSGHVIVEETTPPTSQEETTQNSNIFQIIVGWISKIWSNDKTK